MTCDRLGQRRNGRSAPQHPPSEPGQRTADHRADCPPHGTAVADAGQQRAECVVVREVFDGVQQQRRGGPGCAGQQADDDDGASEFKGAPGHQVNLCQATGMLLQMETPRLLFVHAHPDDETLTTGATIAHYVAHGARVQVVTCTLGEEGEVIGDRWAHLAVDAADQLGGFRIGELTAALRALGIGEPTFLGGAGRWRDSGMEGTPPRHHQRFIDADP